MVEYTKEDSIEFENDDAIAAKNLELMRNELTKTMNELNREAMMEWLNRPNKVVKKPYNVRISEFFNKIGKTFGIC